MAKASPIFKNCSKSDLNNYRPLSVIPTVAKILEKNIYDQLYQYLNENGLLNSGQSGRVSARYTALLLPCWRQTITGLSILIEVLMV